MWEGCEVWEEGEQNYKEVLTMGFGISFKVQDIRTGVEARISREERQLNGRVSKFRKVEEAGKDIILFSNKRRDFVHNVSTSNILSIGIVI